LTGLQLSNKCIQVALQKSLGAAGLVEQENVNRTRGHSRGRMKTSARGGQKKKNMVKGKGERRKALKKVGERKILAINARRGPLACFEAKISDEFEKIFLNQR